MAAKIFMPYHNHNNNATNSSGNTITIANCPICLNTFAEAIPPLHIWVDKNSRAGLARAKGAFIFYVDKGEVGRGFPNVYTST